MKTPFHLNPVAARRPFVALLGMALVAAAPVWAQNPVDAGQKIAAQGTPQGVLACVSCHGAQGEGNAAFPRLAGTGQLYLQAQLDAFADGSRKNAVMMPIAQQLTPAERLAVTRYYSQLPAPFRAADAASPKPGATGAWLASRGLWSSGVPACAQCHGPGGNGVGAQFPPLAGLPAAYITAQLLAWKTDSRPPGPLALMPHIAKALSEADMTAVADYYAQLGAAPALSASAKAATPANPAAKKPSTP